MPDTQPLAGVQNIARTSLQSENIPDTCATQKRGFWENVRRAGMAKVDPLVAHGDHIARQTAIHCVAG